MFDFVNPVFALRRLIDWGSKLRLDEPEAGGNAKHAVFVLTEEAPVMGQGFFALKQLERMMMAGTITTIKLAPSAD